MTKRKNKVRRTGRFSTVTTCISTTLVLILLGTVVLFVGTGTNFSRQLREGLTIEVILHDSLSNRQLVSIQSQLRRAPFARRVNYISKERGTREMNAALQGDMGEFLGASPIPAEFEVSLHAAYANLDSLARYEQSLRRIDGVADVSYPKSIMQSLDRTIPAVGTGLLIVALLLTLVSVALIHNTLRMSVYARRFGIHTMKLVGASWGFIRRPFLLQALRIGLVSSILSAGVLSGAMYFLQYEAGAGDIYLNTLITPEVWAATLGVIFVCGIGLTLWCAYISVNRHLRMKGGEVYIR